MSGVMAAATLRIPHGQGQEREQSLQDFADGITEIGESVGFKMSARGWCYLLEGLRLINKDQFDQVENAINTCRENGMIPIDFTAEEEGRKFSGIEDPDTGDAGDLISSWLGAVAKCERYYTPDWWEGERYYIQMLVEKIDLKTLFEPVCKKYHIPVATCFDTKTELLTRDGWKTFNKVTLATPVATMGGDGNLHYVRPSRVVIEDYTGPMVHIVNRATDQLLTPNHRVYIKRQRNNPENAQFELAQVQKVAHLKNLKFKKSVRWVGLEKKDFILPSIPKNKSHNTLQSKLDMNTWLEFLGYYLSEGSTTAKPNGVFRVQLSQRDGNIKTKMMQCVERLGYNYYSDWQSIQISNKQLFTYLHPLGKAWEKYIPREYMNLPPHQLRILLKSLVEGDGYIRRSIGGQSRAVFVTSSKHLADDVQEISLKAGYNATVSPRRDTPHAIKGRVITSVHQAYSVNISKGRAVFEINHGKNDVTQEHYSGKIWCVEVPSGIIYVRRNGKPVWTGNSKGWSSMLQRAEYARRFKEASDRNLMCVLLYAGDHDPDGLRISEHLRNNLDQLKNIFWDDGTEGYDPKFLIIERFGLNYDFIIDNNLTWINNLITGSGKNLADPGHKNYHMEYVQNYLKTVGARKCEANAIVKNAAMGRQLCTEAIEKFLNDGTTDSPDDALTRFQKKRDRVDRYIRETRRNVKVSAGSLEDAIQEAIKTVAHEPLGPWDPFAEEGDDS